MPIPIPQALEEAAGVARTKAASVRRVPPYVFSSMLAYVGAGSVPRPVDGGTGHVRRRQAGRAEVGAAGLHRLPFEHSVANMTLFGLGIFHGSAAWGDLWRNLAFTVPGNIVGGGLLVGLGYAWIGRPAAVTTASSASAGSPGSAGSAPPPPAAPVAVDSSPASGERVAAPASA